MIKLQIKTHAKKEVLDITDKINEEIKKLEIKDGMGKLVLGTWQKVILIEFDGPRERQIIISQVNMQ